MEKIMNLEIKESLKVKLDNMTDEEYGLWLSEQIKKKQQELDNLKKLSRERLYEVEKKRLKK